MNNLRDAQREMRERSKPPREASDWFSMQTIAKRWDCSVKHAQRICEMYRGKVGFQDQGIAETMHKRKSAFIRISPTLLRQIEDDFKNTKR